MPNYLNQSFITPTHKKTLLRILPELGISDELEAVAFDIIVGDSVQPSDAYLLWLRIDNYIFDFHQGNVTSDYQDLSEVIINSIKQSVPKHPRLFNEDTGDTSYLTPTQWFDAMRYIALHGDLYDAADVDGDFVVDEDLYVRTIVFLRQTPKELTP